MLKQIFSKYWLSLLLIAIVIKNAYMFVQLNTVSRDLVIANEKASTYYNQYKVARSFNHSLNKTLTRIQEDAIANQKLVNAVIKDRDLSNKQLADDIDAMKKGFESAKDSCQFARPPVAVSDRVRSIYARGGNQG